MTNATTPSRFFLPFAAALLLASTASPAAEPQDLGPKAATDVKSVSLYLKLHDRDGLARFIDASTDPQSASYHKFLTPEEFAARYSPSAAEVAEVVRHLQLNGLSVTSVSKSRLVIKASGTVAGLNRYFGTELHEFAQGPERFHAPTSAPTLPSLISGSVASVAGLSSARVSRPKTVRVPHAEQRRPAAPPVRPDGSTATGIAGQYTVGDVAAFYQLNPLYSRGFKGQGRTVGIATLANFDPADAYAYWKGIGLKVKLNRIKQVHVDGGGDFNGADETALDVQQSGGLAPLADVIVYDAPNTDAGFVDVFAAAVDDNLVETLSVSWGSAEIFAQLGGTDLSFAQDQIFMQAAAQGISLFAASGDAGAFDFNASNQGNNLPSCVNVLTVDAPSSSAFITAAGGLTLPGLQRNAFPTPLVYVPKVRPWGWNYLAEYINTNYGFLGGYYGLAFPVGGGGGVSVDVKLPGYQRNTPGIKTSAPSQSIWCQGAASLEHFLDLPDNFAGRNVPDVSLNADPFTGYLLYFQGGFSSGSGGTSFVAPQLNGITAIIGQSLGTRLGLLNPALYRLARNGSYGKDRAFNDITAADNLGYQAGPGYDQASGIGSINAANLAAELDQAQVGEK